MLDQVTPSNIIQVPISKAGAYVDIDVNDLPDHVYKAALEEGMKVFLNKGMAKILTKGKEGEALEEAKKAALAKAEANKKALLSGEVKKPKVKKATGTVNIEAMRLARALVKEILKKNKIKITGQFSAKDISDMAKQVIESNPSVLEQAKANVEAREKAEIVFDITTLVDKKDKPPLSAKQAGMVQRHKPQAPRPQPRQ